MDYKKILEGVINIINTTEKSDIGFANICTYIGENCPELAESEDESIRKAIIEQLKSRGQGSFAGYPMPTILAWLEKQGENNMDISEATKKKLEDNLNKALEKETPESWNEFLEKQGEQEPVEWHREDEQNLNVCLGYIPDEFLRRWLTDVIHTKYDKPADKVEPKFREGEWITNGDYTWKVVEVKPLDYILQSQDGNIVDDTISHVDEQFHSFTIEDAKDGDVLNSVRFQATIIFKGFADDDKHILAYCGLQKGIFISQEILWNRDFEPASEYWKNALYDAMTARGYEWDADRLELKKIEQKPAWSEDDNDCLNAAINNLEYLKNNYAYHQMGLKPAITFLKSLKERVQPQLKQEWSEEDESHIRYLIEYLEHCKKGVALTMTTSTSQEYINWLKSLRPQSTWKPSDEQMDALETAVSTLQSTALESLYNKLKKL